MVSKPTNSLEWRSAVASVVYVLIAVGSIQFHGTCVFITFRINLVLKLKFIYMTYV